MYIINVSDHLNFIKNSRRDNSENKARDFASNAFTADDAVEPNPRALISEILKDRRVEKL